jgi:predicted  nucleic acid-binding Zn-ribbon protein
MPDTSRKGPKLDEVLAAVSEDLDALGDEIANVSGRIEEVATLAEDTRDETRAMVHKLDTLIDLIKLQVLPVVQEVPALRRRVVDAEDRVARLRLVGIRDAE